MKTFKSFDEYKEAMMPKRYQREKVEHEEQAKKRRTDRSFCHDQKSQLYKEIISG